MSYAKKMKKPDKESIAKLIGLIGIIAVVTNLLAFSFRLISAVMFWIILIVLCAVFFGLLYLAKR